MTRTDLAQTKTVVSDHKSDWVSKRLAEIDYIEENVSEKANALIELASQLLPSRSEILKQAPNAGQPIPDQSRRDGASAVITLRLPDTDPQQLEQALSAAQIIPDEQSRAEALAAIAPQLPDTKREKVLEQALTTAQSIKSGQYRAKALTAIASQLSDTKRVGALEQALTTAQSLQSRQYRVKALAAIAPQLPDTERAKVLEQALAAVQLIQDEYYRTEALSVIAPHLPGTEPSLLEQALNATQSIQSGQYRAEALSAIAPRLPDTEPQLLEQALNATQSIQSWQSRAKALTAIALRLPDTEPQLLAQALAAAQDIKDKYRCTEALVAIALHLPDTKRVEALERILTAAGKLEDKYYCAKALTAIASYLPDTERAKALEPALTAAQTIRCGQSCAEALAGIARQLPDTELQLLAQAITAAQDIKDEYYRTEALSAIASRLPDTEPQLLAQALTTAQSIESGQSRADALAAIAPRLPDTEPQLLAQALTAAQSIESGQSRAKALSAIALRLPDTEPQLLAQALTAARDIQDEYYRTKALTVITPQLLAQAPTAQTIQSGQPHVKTLAANASHLLDTERVKALEQELTAAQAIRDVRSRAETLVAIAPQLSEPQLPHFLKPALSLAGKYVCEVLTSPAIRFTEALAIQLPSDKHSDALKVVQALPQDADKTKFLSALVPHLSVGLLPNALRLIQNALTQDTYRVEALNNLLPYLPINQLPEALKIVIDSIKSPRQQTTALENLIPLLSSRHFDQVLRLIENNRIIQRKLQARILFAVVAALATEELDDTLSKLDIKLIPEPDAVFEHTESPADLTDLIDRAFILTQRLKLPQQDNFSYEKKAAKILSQLAPILMYLSESRRQHVFGAVQQFKDLGYQAQALIAFSPYFPNIANSFLINCSGDDYHALLNIKVRLALPGKLDVQVLETLKTIQGKYRRAEALVEIACHPDGGGHQPIALQTIRGLSNTYLKAQYLQRLTPYLLYTQRLEAASVIREIENLYHRVKAFVSLACKFPEFRTEANADVMELVEDPVQRVEQLSALAVEMPRILPRIIEIAQDRGKPKGNGTSEAQDSYQNLEKPIECTQILVALAPHLPMRINREVDRERSAGRLISSDLWNRALYLLARGYRDALQGGSLRNESSQDKDSLNLQDEINALSDMLLMRDLEPPMAVGILGGWGGGKSCIMHLMQIRMCEVRSLSVGPAETCWNPDSTSEKLSPYVGHIYQIKFDAWTFAKSDLWASLMQTIFFELNRQITLEQELRTYFEEKGIDSDAQNSSYAGIWQVLYKASDEDRKYFLQDVLKIEDLEQLKREENFRNRLNIAEKLLWGRYRNTKEESLKKLSERRFELETTETELSKKREELDKNKRDFELNYQQVQQRSAQELQEKPSQNNLNKVVGDALGVSGLILKKRIGSKAFDDLKQEIIKQLPPAVDLNNSKSFSSELQKAVAKVLEGDEDSDPTFQFSWNAIKQWISTNFTFLIVFGIFASASVLLTLAPSINSLKPIPQIVALITPLLPTIVIAQKLWNSAQKWHDQARQALEDYENQIEAYSQRYIDRETKAWLQQPERQKQQRDIANLEHNIQTFELKQQQLQVEIQKVEKELPENLPASLADYVASRIQAGTYDKQLGPMHQVKQDLTDLSRRLLPPPMSSVTTEEYEQRMLDLKEVFPRGPARVIVYIDDLDRCPPDRVVQVLEAVQLLVKTPLFIAVLAVDERYITRALEKFYDGVLTRRGRPSGTDYLEKIIQLPYRVRPIMASTLEPYLRSQVVIQDNATGEAKFSEFSRQEFNMLLACCQQVDLTPRTLKRLTNVYKLFKIVCRTRGTKPNATVQQAILALLALSGRYPNLMRGIFDEIESCFEEQRTCEEAAKTSQPDHHLNSPLRAFFEHYRLPEGDCYLQRNFDKLRHDALQTTILPSALTLHDMTHEIFNLIRSFSFVGEIGECPEDYRVSKSEVGSPSRGLSSSAM